MTAAVLEETVNAAQVAEAAATLTRANAAVTAYIDRAFRGLPHTWGYLHGSLICLRGHGRVWRDSAGRRTCIQQHLKYGDWQRLDALIEEAKAVYAARGKR